jgi:anti-repressor protein
MNCSDKGETMNELIKVSYNENQEPTVNGRELHEFLESKEPYTKWFNRMVEYGFAENIDFSLLHFGNTEITAIGNSKIDHVLKLDMAKEISMLQRNERGKQARQYFIAIEKEWNTPEKIMARALLIADREILKLTNQIEELEPKANYADRVIESKGLVPITLIAKDYGTSAYKFNQLLKKLRVQFKINKTWTLYAEYQDKGYVGSKTYTYISSATGEEFSKINTEWTQKGRFFLYELLKKHNILPLIEKDIATPKVAY